MTTLTDRIAEVLMDALETGLAHPHQRNFVAIEGELDLDELATHLAHEVAEALHLIEENRTLTDGWIQPTRNAGYYAAGMEPPPAVVTHERRWVSVWEEEP